MDKTTAILMLKAPIPGRVKTRLAKDVGETEACRIYQLLVERQLESIPKEWEVEIHYDPPEEEERMRQWLGDGIYRPQSDGDLGARLTHAMEKHFEENDGRLVFLGGDCPYLTCEILEESLRNMVGAEVLVNPSLDGGYTMIALARNTPEVFAGIDWGTERVFEQTMERCRDKLQVVVGKSFEDIDFLSDWDRARASLGLN